MKIREHKGAGRRNRKGFSLSELLISMGIMAFVSLAAIGGIALVSRIRETMDRKAQAQMIMLATVNYMRADLNACTNPQTMSCDSSGELYFTFKDRYSTVLGYDEYSGSTGNISRVSPQVKYYNSEQGIVVNCKCDGYLGNDASFAVPDQVTEYVIAEDVIKGSGLITQIVGPITYSDESKLFTFTIQVKDPDEDKVILSQEIIVCPYNP